MSEQPPLFGEDDDLLPIKPIDFDAFPIDPDAPVGHVGPPRGRTIEEMFWLFHDANPHVYRALCRKCREARARGVKRLGINMLIESLRWDYTLHTGGDDFKINNNNAPYYARLIMHNEPDLAGIFETRKLHAREPDLTDEDGGAAK